MPPGARVITDDAVQRGIVDKYHQDEAFRAQMQRDPKAAVESLGFGIPEDAEVRVEGDFPYDRLVIYSPQVSELTEDDLRQVTGGLAMPTFQLNKPVYRAVAMYDRMPVGTPLTRF